MMAEWFPQMLHTREPLLTGECSRLPGSPPVNAGPWLDRLREWWTKCCNRVTAGHRHSLALGFRIALWFRSEACTGLRKRRGEMAGLKLSLSPEDQAQGGVTDSAAGGAGLSATELGPGDLREVVTG